MGACNMWVAGVTQVGLLTNEWWSRLQSKSFTHSRTALRAVNGSHST